MRGFGDNQQAWQAPQWGARMPRSGNRHHQGWQQPQGRLMLMVTRTNDPLPRCDKIFWLTSQFGPTERVSTFSKEGKNQVVVQFQNVEDCAAVIRFLNGKELDGVVLKCVHSTMAELTFMNNDSRNRMYYDWNQCIEHCMSTNYHTKLCRQQAQQLFEQVQRSSFPLGTHTDSSTLFPHDVIWGQHCFGGGYYYPHSPQRVLPQKPPSQRSPARVANQSRAVDYDSLHVSGLPDDEGLFGAVQLYKLFSMLGNPCGARMLASYPGTAVVSFPSQEEANVVLRVFQSGAPIELVPGKQIKVQPSHQRRTMGPHLTADVQKVCTRQDRQPVPFLTQAKTHPPSRFLLFWGVRQKDGADAQKKVRSLVTGVRGMDGRGVRLAEGANCVVHKSASPGVCTVSVACSRTDEAITVACELNGLTVDGWEVKLRFTTDLDQLPAGTCLSERGEDVQPPPPQPAPAPVVQPPPAQLPAGRLSEGGRDVQPPPPPPPPGLMFQDAVLSPALSPALASAPMHMYAPGATGQNFEGYPHLYPNQTFVQPSAVMPAVPLQCMYGTGQDVPPLQPTHGVSPVPVEPQESTPPLVPGLAPPPDTCDTPGGPVSDDESMGPEEGEIERRRMAPKTPAAPSPSGSAFVLEKSVKRRTRSQTPPPRSSLC